MLDTGSQIFGLFENQGAMPSTVWIDHEMRVYKKRNDVSAEQIITSIDEMLDSCGELCIENNCPTSGTGDVNMDGLINVIDVVEILNVILNFNGEFTDECAQSSADFNSDNRVNVTDIVAIVNAILNP